MIKDIPKQIKVADDQMLMSRAECMHYTQGRQRRRWSPELQFIRA